MEDTLTSLPDDPQALKQIIVNLSCQRDEWKLKHDQKEIEKLRLEVELLRLRKWYYGRKADALSTAAQLNQMLLGFGQELEQRPLDAQDIPPDAKPLELPAMRRVRRGRRNLAAFDQLPV